MICLSAANCREIDAFTPNLSQHGTEKGRITHAIQSGMMLNGQSLINFDLSEINLKLSQEFQLDSVKLHEHYQNDLLLNNFRPLLGSSPIRAYKRLSNIYRDDDDGHIYLHTSCKSMCASMPTGEEPIPGSLDVFYQLTSAGFKLSHVNISHHLILSILKNPLQNKAELDAMRYQHQDEMNLLSPPIRNTLKPNAPILSHSENPAIVSERDENWLTTNNTNQDKTFYNDLNRNMFNVQGFSYPFPPSPNPESLIDDFINVMIPSQRKKEILKHYHQSLLGGLIHYAVMFCSRQKNITFTKDTENPAMKASYSLSYNPKIHHYSFYGKIKELTLTVDGGSKDASQIKIPGTIRYRFDLTDQGFKLAYIRTSNHVLTQIITGHEMDTSQKQIEKLALDAAYQEELNDLHEKIKQEGLTHEITICALQTLHELKQYYLRANTRLGRIYYQKAARLICKTATQPQSRDINLEIGQFIYSDRLSRKVKGYLLTLLGLSLIAATVTLCITFPELIMPIATLGIIVTGIIGCRASHFLLQQATVLKQNMHVLFMQRNTHFELQTISSCCDDVHTTLSASKA